MHSWVHLLRCESKQLLNVCAVVADGLLASYRISLSGVVNASTYAEIFTVGVPDSRLLLSPMHRLPLSSTNLTANRSTLTALHSSFVLLASLKPSSTLTEDAPVRVATVIWDVRLGAVVSDPEIAIPAAALPSNPSTSRQLSLGLSLTSKDTATLSVCPTAGTSGRSLIFVIPLVLPSASVLAAVVGKQALTRKYMAEDVSSSSPARRNIEPVRHPKTSKSKLALLDASAKARADVLEQLTDKLRPLETGSGNVKTATKDADEIFNAFIASEKQQLEAYAMKKAQLSAEKERERRVAAAAEKALVETSSKKYARMTTKIEEAIAAVGGEWKEVTAKRIKNVSDVYRYKYYEVRKAQEDAEGRDEEEAFVVKRASEKYEVSLFA